VTRVPRLIHANCFPFQKTNRKKKDLQGNPRVPLCRLKKATSLRKSVTVRHELGRGLANLLTWPELFFSIEKKINDREALASHSRKPSSILGLFYLYSRSPLPCVLLFSSDPSISLLKFIFVLGWCPSFIVMLSTVVLVLLLNRERSLPF